LDEGRRKELFERLIALQDAGHGVEASGTMVAKEFHVSRVLVVQTEREGVDAQWPPLG
jgi:hypothetical protein